MSIFSKENTVDLIAARNTLLEKMAEEAEANALIKKNSLFVDAQVEYERDLRGYVFKCERWGDWLKLSIVRGGNLMPTYDGLTYCTAINLKLVKSISVRKGHLPDMGGELRYKYQTKKIGSSEGGYIFSSGDVVELRPGYQWDVYADFPQIPTSRPLYHEEVVSRMKANFQTHYISNYNQHTIKFKTPNFVRPAADDTIYFEGLESTLFTPANVGQEIYDQILSAKDTFKVHRRRA